MDDDTRAPRRDKSPRISRAAIITAALVAVLVSSATGGVLLDKTDGYSVRLGGVPVAGAVPAPAGAGVTVELPGATTAASVKISPKPGQGLWDLTRQVCGSGDSWRAQAAANGVVGPNWIIYTVRVYTITCPGASSGGGGTPPAASGWTRPVTLDACFRPNGSREFGAPRDGGARRRMGIDLGGVHGVRSGDNVYAVAAGKVVAVGWSGGAGLRVNVQHPGGVVTKYFHLSSELVSLGQQVRMDQVIGRVGSTGNSTGPHLHFEFHVNGGAVDPIAGMRSKGVNNIAC